MQEYEYRVVPAPSRGIKAKGARTPSERFAAAVAETMNALGREGWEYLRADMLPAEERAGLTRKTTVYHNLLVFRRARQDAQETAPLRLTNGTPAAAPPLVTPSEGSAPALGPAVRTPEPGDAPRVAEVTSR